MSAGFSAAEPQYQVDYRVTGQRIIAAVIDLIVLAVVLLIMVALFGEFGAPEDRATSEGFSVGFRLGAGPFLLYMLLWFAYFIALEGALGATVGKAVMGLKVVKASGEPYSLGDAVVRNLLRFVDGILFYVVGLICIAVTEKRQRIGDLAAGTLVVRAG